MAPGRVNGNGAKAKSDDEQQPLLSRDNDSHDLPFDAEDGNGEDQDRIDSIARRKQRRNAVRYLSFASAILSW